MLVMICLALFELTKMLKMDWSTQWNGFVLHSTDQRTATSCTQTTMFHYDLLDVWVGK